ncbi:MAG: hypothetical protein DCC55_00650 [Chloroflexi bacterium]|nr:MAG: hypothetical protein DCC55_00650 [Chloroflexota bacterium]
MPVFVMSELNHNASLSEQEVQALFTHYLPLQSLPPDMVARINHRIMGEVSIRLRKKLFGWSTAKIWFYWRWRDRRRKRRY